MDVSSPENVLENLNDFLMQDGEIGLNFDVNKEANAGDYVYDDFPRNSESRRKEQVAASSLPSGASYIQISRAHSEDYQPPLETICLNDVVCFDETTFRDDLEGFQSFYKENQHQEESEGICGNDLSKTDSLHNVETEVVAQPEELPTLNDVYQQNEIDNTQPILSSDDAFMESFLETSNYELTRSEIAYEEAGDEVSGLQRDELSFSPNLHLKNGEGIAMCENMDFSQYSAGKCETFEGIEYNQTKLEISRHKSKSPEKVIPASNSLAIHEAHKSSICDKNFGSQQVLDDISSPSRSNMQKTCALLERSDLSRNTSSGACKQNRASPCETQQGSQHFGNYSVEPPCASSRSYRKRERQERSRSPMRRRDFSSRHCREDYYRTQHRSPTRRRDFSSRHCREDYCRTQSWSSTYKSHHHRSPRKRYSSRHKSPHSTYRSSQRSPRRQPWSPPHNRSTGVGKPGRNLFVAGFSFITTERDLERKFSRFGRVRDVRVVRDKRTGDSRGFGFLTLERDEDADEAIRAIDRTEWNGRIVLVEKSKSHLSHVL